jgi:V8-like Glu-specific endopeptidase
MRAVRIGLVGLVAWPLAIRPDVRADDGSRPTLTTAPGGSTVIGGENAPSGRWPDVAAVLFNGKQGCSGTLVAPNIVLTAGHCNDATLTSVLIGTASLANPGDGETIAVKTRVEFPSSQSTEDLTVLVLAKNSKFTPRKIATGWARFDIKNGAGVEIVGYGAIDPSGTKFVDELQQAATTITDASCTTEPGCHPSVKPGGELGAGGMGIDTCPGDSGGPLYLVTKYGEFLAGVTSRAYDNATTACKDGGIYVRPDKVIDQLEQMAGVALARGPEPSADTLTISAPGDGGDILIAVNDPKTKSHDFTVTTPPAHGTAKLRSDGAFRVCSDPAQAPGDDSAVVTITDSDDSSRTLTVTIPITVQSGTPPVAICDIDAFSIPESGGCCDSGHAHAGSIPLAVGVALIALRKRRRR